MFKKKFKLNPRDSYYWENEEEETSGFDQEGFDQEHQGPKSQLTSPSIHGTASQPHSRGNALMMFANWRPNAYSDYIWQI